MASLHLRAKLVVLGGLGILCFIFPGSARAGGVSPICPNEDLAGRRLEDQSFGATIFCVYETSPNHFYCIYDATNGDLSTDNDAGFCPATAVTPMAAPTPTSSAPAPALTPWGLIVAVILLASVGAFALRLRMRSH